MTSPADHHRLTLDAQALDEGGHINSGHAVDLARAVLDLAEHAGMTARDMTAQETAQRCVAGMMNVPADFNAWLDAIRTELYGKAPR